MSKYWIINIFLSLATLLSCSSSDDSAVLNYIAQNNLEATYASGVYVVVENRGVDTIPTDLAVVIDMNYSAYYLDGELFDSTASGDTSTLNLNDAVEGVRLGIISFGRGGKGKILIPSSLGYGSNPPRGVRKNADLIYEIELYDFR